MTKHPKGTGARILLSSVFGPYAQDDAYGSRTINPMELYHCLLYTSPHLHFAQGFSVCIRVLPRLEFFSPLQNADALAGARHSGRGNAATVTGADHHDRIVVLYVFDQR